MMEIPTDIFTFVIGFVLALPIIGYIFRFSIPISLFFFIAGGFLLTLLLSTDSLTANALINGNNTVTTTANPHLDYIMNVTSGSTSIQLANTNFGASERPVNINSALYNTPISCIMLDLSKSGSPTGNANIGILGGAGTVIKSFGTIDVTTLATSQKSYKFCLSSHDFWIIGLYDRIGIFYNAGSVGNGVNVYLDGTNPFDGSRSDRSTLSSGLTWTDVANSDLRMVLTYDDLEVIEDAVFEDGGFDFSLEGENYYLKVVMIFISAMYMLGGAIVEVKTRK